MANNSFGTLFRITTWGESHGKAIGVVIDGCPAGLELQEEEIREALSKRATGKTPYTSARKEKDHAEILSGVFEGKTTGAPISIIIPNTDADPSKYTPIKNLFKPGHAHYTYLEKYGIYDYRGSGRASARETACRVAAGCIAKKLIEHYKIQVTAYVKQIGEIEALIESETVELLRTLSNQSPIFCPDLKATSKMITAIETAKNAGDSLGGIIEFIATDLPVGLGDPIYEKLEAKLASAMMSLPASKGFEIGTGFRAAAMAGSVHNDILKEKNGKIYTATNHAGGTLGGISNGMPLIGRVSFKPASSIRKPQETLTTSKQSTTLQFPEGSRHDPCLTIRAAPVVEAMLALVLADCLLLSRCARLC